jgi:hypothetical protein
MTLVMGYNPVRCFFHKLSDDPRLLSGFADKEFKEMFGKLEV